MSVHRFFVDQQLDKTSKRIHISDTALLHQWRTVLRLSPGATVVLFSHGETEATYTIHSLSKQRADLVLKSTTAARVPKRNICLAWSLLKRENNELVVQKGTELGVNQFIPVIADRCVRSHVSQVRTDRWQRIVREAAEQCGRGNIPLVNEPMLLTELITSQPGASLLVCRPGNQQPQDIPRPSDITVFVGPEGGWSLHEEQLFDKLTITSLPLGDFTLRAETAAIAAIARLA